MSAVFAAGLFAGLFIGGMVGFLLMAILVAGAEADRRNDEGVIGGGG